MKIKSSIKKGFTLIELMIVVAIIGILASVAIPAYQNYTKSATIAAAVSEASSYKTAIALCAQRDNGLYTGCKPGEKGVPADAGKVSVADDGTAVISITTGVPDVATVTFTPQALTGGQVQWVIACTTSNDTDSADQNNLFKECPTTEDLGS